MSKVILPIQQCENSKSDLKPMTMRAIARMTGWMPLLNPFMRLSKAIHFRSGDNSALRKRALWSVAERDHLVDAALGLSAIIFAGTEVLSYLGSFAGMCLLPQSPFISGVVLSSVPCCAILMISMAKQLNWDGKYHIPPLPLTFESTGITEIDQLKNMEGDCFDLEVALEKAGFTQAEIINLGAFIELLSKTKQAVGKLGDGNLQFLPQVSGNLKILLNKAAQGGLLITAPDVDAGGEASEIRNQPRLADGSYTQSLQGLGITLS